MSELTEEDFVYDPAKGGWILLVDFKAEQQILNNQEKAKMVDEIKALFLKCYKAEILYPEYLNSMHKILLENKILGK